VGLVEVVIVEVGYFSNYSHYFVVVQMVELLFELIVMFVMLEHFHLFVSKLIPVRKISLG
jgi:hypothetical protein